MLGAAEKLTDISGAREVFGLTARVAGAVRTRPGS